MPERPPEPLEIEQLLEKRRDEIIRVWTEQARRSPAAQGLSDHQLVSSIHEYLSSLTGAFHEPAAGSSLRREGLVETHLAARLRQGFNLDEVVHEYMMLGEAVSRIWSGPNKVRRPPASDIERFYFALNEAITTAVGTYTRHLLEDEQDEKRYLRLLDQLAAESLAQGASLERRGTEITQVIMEAVKAESAALFSYVPGTNKLKMEASTGLGAGEVGRYAPTLGNSSFVAKVAGTDDVVTLFEELTAHAEVSAALQRSGIESLLGHRLWARERLLGVLYVGLKASRAFNPWERRRLGSLVNRLALLTDNAQLFKELKDANRNLQMEHDLREQFVSVLAHDLRGPLSVAKIGATLLMEHPELLDRRRDLAVRIDRSIDRADRMVRDLLDANLIRAGKRLPLRLEECDLSLLAAEVVDELTTLHGSRFEIEADDRVRGIWSTEELHRAIFNLMVNAVVHGVKDSPIVIRVRRTATGAEVSVHNAGPPIPAEAMARLFEPFRRSPAATAAAALDREARGWGLGLTLVRGCAQAHGGEVMVVSTEEAGTTFTLVLPRDARPYQPKAEEGAAAAQPPTGSTEPTAPPAPTVPTVPTVH